MSSANTPVSRFRRLAFTAKLARIRVARLDIITAVDQLVFVVQVGNYPH